MQDPQDFSNREIKKFEHLRQAKSSISKDRKTLAARNIRTNAATDRILQELEAKKMVHKESAIINDYAAESLIESNNIETLQTSSFIVKKGNAAANEDRDSGKLQLSHSTSGKCSSSFTSSVIAPVTENAITLASEQELLQRRWQTVRKLKKKGLVQLETTFGKINLEVDCDFVPQTADNFLSLCQRKYYDGVLFHRVIRGFMMQGGDPTGTGRGGESIYKKPFRDEIDDRLTHNSRGVLSMANSGPGTNKSQFFITFNACTHLDKKHTIFGRVVGGMDVLDIIEHLNTGAEDRPFEDVRIKSTQIFANPFQEYDEALAQGLDFVQHLKRKEICEATAKEQGSVLKVSGKWVAFDDLRDVDVASIPLTETLESDTIGKYLNINENVFSKKHLLEPQTAVESKKKKTKDMTTGKFGKFFGW